jgi:hypothetical protein
VDVQTLCAQLAEQVTAVQNGDMREPEAIHVAQAITLNGMFAKLSMLALESLTKGNLDAFERVMRQALRAQSNCRMSLEALAELKTELGFEVDIVSPVTLLAAWRS